MRSSRKVMMREDGVEKNGDVSFEYLGPKPSAETAGLTGNPIPEGWDAKHAAVHAPARRRLLAETEKLSVEEIMARMDEGLPKLWLIHRALGLRRLHPEIFTSGDYQPLIAYGEKAGHVIAFSRDERVVTVAPRLVLTLAGDWGNTWLELVRGSWRNVLTEDRLDGGKVSIHELLDRFPVALLWKET